MARKAIFDSRRVSRLLEKLQDHPKSQTIRQDIMQRAYPLIDAAITRKRLFLYKEDLRQECALKLLKALPKYKRGRGSAFAFFWSTIHNCLKTHVKRLSKGGLSIDTEEDILKEVEVSGPSVYQTPEYRYLQKVLSKAIDSALYSRGLRVFNRDKDKKALDYIKQSVLNGDLFAKKGEVLKKLRRFGVRKKNAKFLIDYLTVDIRDKLYSRKDLLDALTHRKTISNIPEIPDS